MLLVRYAADAGSTYGLTSDDTLTGEVQPVGGLLDHRPVGEPVSLSEVRLLAPVEPVTVLGMAHNTGPADRELPAQAFFKPAASVVGPGEAIVVPGDIGIVEPEAELAVVIGARCRGLVPEEVPDAVLGWTAANDVTARDLQVSDPLWIRAKAFDTFTPLGPAIRLGMPDPDLTVALSVDGGPEVTAPLSALARDVTEILCYLTTLMTLRPGDVVLLGAPASRVEVPLHPGMEVSVRIDSLPALVNPVAAP